MHLCIALFHTQHLAPGPAQGPKLPQSCKNGGGSQSSLGLSSCLHSSCIELHVGSGSESDTEAESNMGNESQYEEEEGGSDGEGSGGEGSGGEGSGDEGSGDEGSGREDEGSGSEDERSGSGEEHSRSSESEEDAGKVQSDGETADSPSEADANASQAISLPEVNGKASEDEWKNSHHDFAHSKDVHFSTWRD